MRNGTIDLMRLVAASGIVIFHAQTPGQAIGLSGLSFFVLLIPLFSLTSERSNRPIRALISDRGKRLMGPWLAWSALYAGLKLADAAFTGSPLAEEFRPWMLLTGPAMHLWFLPFAFVTTVMLSLVGPHVLSVVAHWPWLRMVVASACAGLSLLTTQAVTPPIEPPLPQYMSAAPALLFGMSLGLVASVRLQMAVCLAPIPFFLLIGPHGYLLQLTIAAAALCICLARPIPTSELSKRAASVSLTVYLLHPMVLSLLERGFQFERQGVQLGVYGLAATLILSIIWDQITIRIRRRRALSRTAA